MRQNDRKQTLLEHVESEIKELKYSISCGNDPMNARNHMDGWTLAGFKKKLKTLNQVKEILKNI